MPRTASRPSRRALGVPLVVLLGAAATLLPAATVPPAATAAPRAPDSGATRSVVLRLAAPPPGAPGALADLLPAAATRAATEAQARALGLSVTSADALSVTVTGPASMVEALLPRSGAGTGATRRTPPTMRGTVALAVDADDTTPIAHPQATLTGEQLVGAYGAPLPAGYPRTRPALDARTPVVATLQLSGWDSRALTTFAQREVFTSDRSYDPVTGGQLTEVAVDRSPAFAPTGARADDDGSAAEVALDQQALLAVAPSLRQRAYFASNSARGYLAALDRVLADAQAGVPLVALSTSWGACEASYDIGYLAEVERTLARLNAAGVTTFAASGDDGLADCTRQGDERPAVDYPASSPQVVGVGGTSHPNAGDPPLPDTAWSAPDRGRGTGGGASKVFARPSWQALAGSGAARQVPDLALPADLSSGFAVYTTESRGGGSRVVRGPSLVGGTSLAAPLAAGMLADALVAQDPQRARGLGDVHRALYAAAAAGTGFRDVVTVASNTPRTIAPPGPGYDRATGLGTPDWTALSAPLAAAAPTAPGRAAVAVPALPPVAVPLALTPPAGGDVVAYYAASRDRGCSGAPLPVTGAVVRLPVGVSILWVRALSRDLLCSAAAAVTVTVPYDDRLAARRGRWSVVASGDAVGGGVLQSAAAGATAAWSPQGRAFRVLLATARDGGLAQVLLDGRVVATVDTASSRPGSRSVPLSARAAGRHEVVVRVLGQRGRGSSGAVVRVDALVPAG